MPSNDIDELILRHTLYDIFSAICETAKETDYNSRFVVLPKLYQNLMELHGLQPE